MFDKFKRRLSGVVNTQTREQSEMVELVRARYQQSQEWMVSNFYSQWEQTWKNYKCEKDPYLYEIMPGKKVVDEDRTAVCLPDTLIAVRRMVARATAQTPMISYRGDDIESARVVSRSLMHAWDSTGMNRQWRRNVLQTAIFGWSVMGFSWEVNKFERTRRAFLGRPLPEADARFISGTFGLDPTNPDQMKALSDHLGSQYVKIKRPYVSYIGPRGYLLSVGDCFPQRDFESLQASEYFIVERRRSKQFLDDIAVKDPRFRDGISRLYQKHPNGTSSRTNTGTSGDVRHFRDRMRSALNRTTEGAGSATKIDKDPAKEWTILEMHCPGRFPRLVWVGESDTLICDIEYPMSLDGKIAFAESVYIEDLLSGVGDSSARLMRPLQKARNEMFEDRHNLIRKILRPLIGVRSKRIFDNPDLIKRIKGMMMVKMEGPQDFWVHSDGPAMAAASNGLAEDSSIARSLQMIPGENNMSQGANVDPAQNKTATGARIMNANLDVLSKSDISTLTDSGARSIAEIMFLMYASEMSDEDEWRFDATSYDQRWKDKAENKFVVARPYHYQGEGEVTIEAGSMLADDDESKVIRAKNLYEVATANPDVLRKEKAIELVLTVYGEKNTEEWFREPQPPPPPPPPSANMNVQVKYEALPEDVQRKVLETAGLVPQPPPPPQPPPTPPQPPPQGVMPAFPADMDFS